MASYGYKGWIKLWREEMHNPLYFDEPFTKWQAWMDLQMLVEDDQTYKTSLEALKNRWSWGSTWKVTKLLQILSKMELITVYQTRNKGTQIHIRQGVASSDKSKKQTQYQTRNQTKNQTEEVTSKEVVTSASFEVSRVTEDIEDNKYLHEDDFDD